MSFIDHRGRGQGPLSGQAPAPLQGPADWAAAVMGGAIGVAWLISLFVIAASSIAVAGALIGFSLFVGFLIAAASKRSAPGQAKLGFLLLILSPVWAGISGLIVFWPHWFSFAFAAWVTLALFTAGALSIFRFLSAAWRLVAVAAAAAIAVAIVILPPPNGAFAADDDRRKWSVELTVVDANGDPVRGAGAICIPRMMWAETQRPPFFPETAQRTDDTGQAEFSFNEDTRMKVVLCGAAIGGDRDWSYGPEWAITGTPFYGDALPVRVTLRTFAQQEQ